MTGNAVDWAKIASRYLLPLLVNGVVPTIVGAVILTATTKGWSRFAKRRSERLRESLVRDLEMARLLADRPDITTGFMAREAFKAAVGGGIVSCCIAVGFYIRVMTIPDLLKMILAAPLCWAAGAGIGRVLASWYIGERYSAIFSNAKEYIDRLEQRLAKLPAKDGGDGGGQRV